MKHLVFLSRRVFSMRHAVSATVALVLTASVLLVTPGTGVQAQDAPRPPGGLFGGVFGGSDDNRAQQPAREDSEMVDRLNRIEQQLRQMTGSIEELQFHNKQLQQQIQRMQEDNEYRFQQMGGGHAAPRSSSPAAAPGRRSEASGPQYAGQQETGAQTSERGTEAYRQQPDSAGQRTAGNEQPSYGDGQQGRRSDAFDPRAHPNAPGAPRALGGGSLASADTNSGIGAPGGRGAGQPLDLSNMNDPGGNDRGSGSYDPAATSGGSYGTTNALPPPPAARTAGSPNQRVATLPPSGTPRDQYDLGVGYVEHKDYARAEQTLNGFLERFPKNALAPDARYWLGESLFQRQQYRDAAEQFLTVTTKYDTSGKAPDALLRLGQALKALGEKDTACAAWGEVKRKYPRASVGVRQGVARELKRARC